MTELKDRAREYLAEHSEYSEVFGQTFVAVDTLTAMVEFAEQETKELEAQIEKMKCCGNCAKNGHICVAEEMQGKLCGKNKVKWQLRR